MAWTSSCQVQAHARAAQPAQLWLTAAPLQTLPRHPSQMGAGLHNLGNTCFLNATLQCLTYLPPLANFALAGEHIKHKARVGCWAPVAPAAHAPRLRRRATAFPRCS